MNRIAAAALLLCAGLQLAPAQPADPATNRVVDLDGVASWVELPPNLLHDLDAATVEMWFRLMQFSSSQWARIFSYGDFQRDASIQIQPNGSLQFLLAQGVGNNPAQFTSGAGTIEPGHWYHVAFVSGPGGMKLYFNGELQATNDFVGSFAQTASRAAAIESMSTAPSSWMSSRPSPAARSPDGSI